MTTHDQTLQAIKATAEAGKSLIALSAEKIDAVLRQIADEIRREQGALLQANAKDLARMDEKNPKYDRLKLTAERLEGIASAMEEVAAQTSPIGEVLEEKTLENGIKLQKVRVPLGTIGIIFEARPNVFFDCFALSFKAKNSCVLKGSRDALDSNTAIFRLIQAVLVKNAVNPEVVAFPEHGEEAVETMFTAHGLIEAIIPRGGQGLIDFVRKNSRVPVIETGAGVVHTYLDAGADAKMAQKIIFNAKTSRPSVCNALDCLIVHSSLLADLPNVLAPLAEKTVDIYADERALEALDGRYPLLFAANEEDFGREFLAYKLAIKIVDSLDDALAHIARYSSRHTEAIISQNEANIERFLLEVDAAALFVNASTRFTDGGVFGLGAEIGISTQKLHARGPMGVREITSYKWIGRGDGQVR